MASRTITASSGDTICAIATGAGGGIGIVRISGPRAAEVVRRLIRPWPEGPATHRLYLGRAYDPESDEDLDEVLGCLMRGPGSYTGEDVAEIHGHGGEMNLGRLLEATVRAGARVAEPGEFTRRAFLAGRIDLTQAEAVAEVIAARSARALRVAQAQRSGGLAMRVNALQKRLIVLLAEVEGGIDFPDEDLGECPAIATAVGALGREVAELAATFRRGRILASGVDVALVGRANAGKSSLFNALLGEERALVDAEPGTTRDFIEMEMEFAGLRARVIDTAGEREEATGEGVERRGVELGRRRRARADVMLLVVDGRAGFGEIERRIYAEASAGASAGALLVVWNKRDLAPLPRGIPAGARVVTTAATHGAGLDELRSAVREAVGDLGDEGAVTVTSARQKAALDEAAAALGVAEMALERGIPPELGAVDLRLALDRLGRVTGENVDSTVLDAIFSRFCIGK